MIQVLCRESVDAAIDAVRLRLDLFPRLDYQPVPWLGFGKSRRVAGCVSRWDAIRQVVEEERVSTVVDIGCNVGYFSIKIAQQGVPVVGIEAEPKYFRTFLMGVKQLRLPNASLMVLKITPKTTPLLPNADCVLFMSVWHHLVRAYGLDAATQILRTIWARTQKVMVFETGENEMPLSFGLPVMSPNPAIFLHDYLRDICEAAEVQNLGKHEAFDPSGKCVLRNLLLVRRM